MQSTRSLTLAVVRFALKRDSISEMEEECIGLGAVNRRQKKFALHAGHKVDELPQPSSRRSSLGTNPSFLNDLPANVIRPGPSLRHETEAKLQNETRRAARIPKSEPEDGHDGLPSRVDSRDRPNGVTLEFSPSGGIHRTKSRTEETAAEAPKRSKASRAPNADALAAALEELRMRVKKVEADCAEEKAEVERLRKQHEEDLAAAAEALGPLQASADAMKKDLRKAEKRAKAAEAVNSALANEAASKTTDAADATARCNELVEEIGRLEALRDQDRQAVAAATAAAEAAAAEAAKGAAADTLSIEVEQLKAEIERLKGELARAEEAKAAAAAEHEAALAAEKEKGSGAEDQVKELETKLAEAERRLEVDRDAAAQQAVDDAAATADAMDAMKKLADEATARAEAAEAELAQLRGGSDEASAAAAAASEKIANAEAAAAASAARVEELEKALEIAKSGTESALKRAAELESALAAAKEETEASNARAKEAEEKSKDDAAGAAAASEVAALRSRIAELEGLKDASTAQVEMLSNQVSEQTARIVELESATAGAGASKGGAASAPASEDALASVAEVAEATDLTLAASFAPHMQPDLLDRAAVVRAIAAARRHAASMHADRFRVEPQSDIDPHASAAQLLATVAQGAEAAATAVANGTKADDVDMNWMTDLYAQAHKWVLMVKELSSQLESLTLAVEEQRAEDAGGAEMKLKQCQLELLTLEKIYKESEEERERLRQRLSEMTLQLPEGEDEGSTHMGGGGGPPPQSGSASRPQGGPTGWPSGPGVGGACVPDGMAHPPPIGLEAGYPAAGTTAIGAAPPQATQVAPHYPA